MNKIFLLLLICSCSQVPSSPFKPGTKIVTLLTALDQAQMSYLRGCVETYVELKLPKPFETCRGKSVLHREEIQDIVGDPHQLEP